MAITARRPDRSIMQMSLGWHAPASPGGRWLARGTMYVLVLLAAFFAAAYVGRVPPVDRIRGEQWTAERALNAVPIDAPLPYDRTFVLAGRGVKLPRRVEWVSNVSPGEAAAQVADHLAHSPRWQETQGVDLRGEFTTTFVRTGDDGYLSHFAIMTLRADGDRTMVEFEYMRLDEPRSAQ